MQRQSVYTFSFLEYTGNGEERKRVTGAVMVTAETTRKGKQVFKTRTCWDNEAHTYLDEDGMGSVPDNPDRMDVCHFFWDCMHYAVARCLLEELMEDAVDDGYRFALELPLPRYGKSLSKDGKSYLDMIAQRFPEIELEEVDNGFG